MPFTVSKRGWPRRSNNSLWMAIYFVFILSAIYFFYKQNACCDRDDLLLLAHEKNIRKRN